MKFVQTLIVAPILAAITAMEKRMNAKLDALKAAEDRVGTSIATAIKTNSENLAKIAELIAKQNAGSNTTDDDEALDALIAEAKDHADKLAAAFPETTDPAPAPGAQAATGNDTVSGG